MTTTSDDAEDPETNPKDAESKNEDIPDPRKMLEDSTFLDHRFLDNEGDDDDDWNYYNENHPAIAGYGQASPLMKALAVSTRSTPSSASSATTKRTTTTSKRRRLRIPSSSSSQQQRQRHHYHHQQQQQQQEYEPYRAPEDTTRHRIRNREALVRALLLASSLSLILLAFWLVDSLKDAVFATLVEGELGLHQPRAKMMSVAGTFFIVCLVELAAYHREARRGKRKMASIRADADVLDGGGLWTRMDIRTFTDHHNANDDDDDDDDDESGHGRIPPTIFRFVSLPYAFFFILVAFILRRHPQFQPQEQQQQQQQQPEDNHNYHQHPDDDVSDYHSRTFWHILGYILYFAIESFGSISVAILWSLSNSTLTLSAAERHYGTIIAVAQIGAIVGSTIATSGVHALGVPGLFILTSVVLFKQVSLMEFYRWRFPRPMAPISALSSSSYSQRNIFELDDDDEESDAVVLSSWNDASKRRKKRRHGQSSRNNNKHKIKQQQQQTLRLDDDNSSSSTLPTRNQSNKPIFTSGLSLIFRYNYLLLILGVSCLYEVSLTCLDYEMKLLGLDKYTTNLVVPKNDHDYHHHFDLYDTNDGSSSSSSSSTTITSVATTTFATFMGRYGQLTNIQSLLFSYLIFPFLMKRFGLRYTVLLFPTLLVFVTALAYLALPGNLFLLFVSISTLKAVTYSIHDPTKEILYIPTSYIMKYRAKFWIDVVGARIAKAFGSGINALSSVPSSSKSMDDDDDDNDDTPLLIRYGAVPSLVTALALWIVCYLVGQTFDHLVSNGTIVGLNDDDNDDDDNDETFRYRTIEEIDARDTVDDDDVVMVVEEEEELFFHGGQYQEEEEEDSGWESNTTIELIRR